MENSRKIKGAQYALEAVALTATNPNASARKILANAAIRVGNYTPGAKAVWEQYIADGCPRAS